MSAPRRAGRPRAGLLTVAVAAYAVIVIVGPFLHHDAACHARSRTHCATCHFSAMTSGTESEGTAQALVPPESDELGPASEPRTVTTVILPTNDRSPPEQS